MGKRPREIYNLFVSILLVAGLAVTAKADSVSTPVRIGHSTVHDRATLGIPRWKGYMLESDPNQFWAGYANGSSYRSQLTFTTDGGETWSTNPIQIDPDGYLNMHCSMFGRAGDIYATWPARDGITFRKFNAPIRSNDDASSPVRINGTDVYYRSNIMVQNTGRIWLFTRLSYDDPAENVLFNYSDDDGASWTHGTAYATNHNSVRSGSMPYVDGNPALVVLYLNDSRGFEYYLWNGSRFEAKPDHSIYPVNMRNSRAFTHNVIRDTTFHLVFAVGNELHHVWKNYNNGTGAWNHEIIDSSPNTADMDWSPVSTVRGDELYLFYAKKSTSSDASSRIYEMKWSQQTQTWTEPILISTDASGVTDRDPNTTFRVPESSPYIPVYWSRGSSPYDIYFAKVNVESSTPVPINMDCPADTVYRELCGPSEVCLPLDISNATGVTVEGGTWSGGTLCLNADTSGVYSPIVTAYNASDTVTCEISVRVQVNPTVEISCPSGIIALENCTPTTMQVSLPITNATQVRVTGATWSNDVLSFYADTSGTYSYLATAGNDCGELACNVIAEVSIAPNIDLNTTDEDVTVSNSEPTAGDEVTLFASVNNTTGSRTALNVPVRFYDGDPASGGVVIGNDQTIASLDGGESGTVEVQYTVPDQNEHDIYAVIDPDGQIAECFENNNSGMITIIGIPAVGAGTISGTVSEGSTSLHGVTIDLLDNNGHNYLAAVTDNSGYYQFDSISSGNYIVDLMVPLGFGSNGVSTVPIEFDGTSTQIDFNLENMPSDDISDYWWWEKQIQGIRDGATMYSGLTREAIDQYCESIFEHFHERTDGYAVNIEDVTYVGNPPRALDFEDIAHIWLDIDHNANPVKTRIHLLTSLLDIASDRLDQMAVVTRGGATVSQAITYIAGRYMDGYTDDWTLWYDLFLINAGIVLDAGEIPLSTPNIVYKSTDDGNSENLPGGFELTQNRPNPFNSSTAIRFTISKAAEVKLEVYNVNGQLVENIFGGFRPAGTYTIRWDADAYASGIYFYRLTAGDRTESRKMVLLK